MTFFETKSINLNVILSLSEGGHVVSTNGLKVWNSPWIFTFHVTESIGVFCFFP